MEYGRQMNIMLEILNGCQCRILHPNKTILQEGKHKLFPGKQKQNLPTLGFIHNRIKLKQKKNGPR